jgi:hypothetical protein
MTRGFTALPIIFELLPGLPFFTDMLKKSAHQRAKRVHFKFSLVKNDV